MRNFIPKNASLVPENAKLVFQGVMYDTYQWQQQMFDGTYKTFEMLKRPDTLKILAVKDNKIIVLEQEQPGIKTFYDLPGGRHDEEGESELDGAKREMLEETGMTFKKWRLIDASQPLLKIEQFVYIFLATDFDRQVEQHLDSGEKIKVLQVTLEELKKMIGMDDTRYLPKELLDKVNNLEELLELPEYS